MKTLKSSLILITSLFIFTNANAAPTRVTCHWSNGDHFDLVHSDEAFIDSVIASCMDSGGTVSWEPAVI